MLKNKEILSDDKLFDIKKLDQLDPELEKKFAIDQLIYLIELFIKDIEFINYSRSMLFSPLDQIYESIDEKTEELKLLYERVKMSEIYIKYYNIFKNNSLQVETFYNIVERGNTMNNLLDELTSKVKTYIDNKESKEKIFLSVLRIKQINDSLRNSFNDKIITNSKWILKVLVKYLYSDSLWFQKFLFECMYSTYKLYCEKYNNIILMDTLNKENFNDSVHLKSVDEKDQDVIINKRNILKELGDHIISVLKYYKKQYSETLNQDLKILYSKYISWYKIFLFVQQMKLVYNGLPFSYENNEFGNDLPGEFKLVYEDVVINKHENLDRNIIQINSNKKSENDDFIMLWSKSFEIENRELIEKRKDPNNFFYNDDCSVFLMKTMEVEFKEDDLENVEEIIDYDDDDKEEERGRSKNKKSKSHKKSSKSKSRSRSKSKSHNGSKSRSRSASRNKNEKRKSKNESKNKNKRLSKRFEYIRNREPLPSEKKLNEIAYSVLKVLKFWTSDKNRLFVLLKSLPNLADVNLNYRMDYKNHETMTSYGYSILAVIYIALDLITLQEGCTVTNERIDTLRESSRVILCPCFEFLDDLTIVQNIINKGIPIKYIIILWQILFQLMEWNLFLKISQVLQKYYENNDDEFKNFFYCEWSIYVNICLFFSDINKKDDSAKVDEGINDSFRKKINEFRKNNNDDLSNKQVYGKTIIENTYSIDLYEKLSETNTEEIEKIKTNLKFGVYSLYKYLIFSIENKMGCISNINYFFRIIWRYCLRLYPEKKDYNCITTKNSIVIVKTIIICLSLYNNFFTNYVNPILYSSIIQQYILILLNNNYDYDCSKFIDIINNVIERVNTSLYSARGTSHKYYSLSYNPSIFGKQFEYMISDTPKSSKKKEIIHSLIHKKYVLYGLIFRIIIIQKFKEYIKEKERKEKEYLSLYKKKLTSYPEFMTKPTNEILETYCGKNNYLKSLFNLQFAIVMKDLPKNTKNEIIQDAFNYIKLTFKEESMLVHHLYLENVNNNSNNIVNENICPPPICIKRSNASLVFRPLPPKNTKPYYYKIFCKENNIGIVTMSDSIYQGTDEFVINRGDETEIIISGLKENSKYIVAVAAYDKNKNLLCGRIGAQSMPLLVALPLPILIHVSYLGQFACIEEISEFIKPIKDILFNYFIESVCDEYELTHTFVKEPYWIKKNSSYVINNNHIAYSTESLIKNFISILMFSTLKLSEKLDKEEDHNSVNEVNASKWWISKKLKLCQKFLICMNLADYINNDYYLITSMIYCYHTVVPFLSFDNPPEFVIHILMKCHAVFMKRDSFEKSTIQNIYEHYFTSLTHILASFLNRWGVKDELNIICKNTLQLIHSFSPRSDRLVLSNTLIDHFWGSTLDKFKKTRLQNKKCSGQADFLYFSASSIYSNNKLIEKTNAIIYLADYIDYLLQINDLGIANEKKQENYSTMADIEYGIHTYSLETMYNEINKYRKSKRYMEMAYKLLSVAFNRKEYEFIYRVYYEILEWINKRNYFILNTDNMNSEEIKKNLKKNKFSPHSIFKPKLDEKTKKKRKKYKRSKSGDSRSSSTDRRSVVSEGKNDNENTNVQKKKSSSTKNKGKTTKKTKSKNYTHQRSLSFDDKWNKYVSEQRSQSFHKKEINRMRSHSQEIRYSGGRNSEEKTNNEDRSEFEKLLAEKEKQNKALNIIANKVGFFWRRRRYKNKLYEIVNNENFYLCMIHYINSMTISKIIEKDIISNEIKAPTLGVDEFYIDVNYYFNVEQNNNNGDQEDADTDAKDSTNKYNIDVEKYITEQLESYIRSMVDASRSHNWNLLLSCFHQLWNFVGDMRKLELINKKYWKSEIWKPFYIVSMELLDFLITHCSNDERFNRSIDILDLIKCDKKRIYYYYYVNRWGYKSDIAINVKLIIKFFVDTMKYLFYSEKYSKVISFGILVNNYFNNTLTEIFSTVMIEAKMQFNLKHSNSPITLPDIYENTQIPNDLKSLGYLVISYKADFINYIVAKYTINNPNSGNLASLLRKAILNYEELIKISKEKDDLFVTAIAYSELGDLLYESGDVESAGLFWSKSIDTIFKKRMVIASIIELYNEIKDFNTTTVIKMFNNSVYTVILIGLQLAKLAAYCFSSNLNTKLNLSLCASFFLSKAMYSYINEPHTPNQFIYVSSKAVVIINIISEFFKDQSAVILKILEFLIIELVNNDYLGLALPLLAMQLIIIVNNNKSIREVIFAKLKYAKILIKCGFISEGLNYLNNVYSGKGIFDVNPLTSFTTTTATSLNGNNNIGACNTSTYNNNNNNSSNIINVSYNNMEELYETNNLNCIKQLLYTKYYDRLVAQYGRMMTKVIDFERISLVIEIFSLYHGNFVYYDPIKGMNDNTINESNNKSFDIKVMKQHIYEDILGVNIKGEKNNKNITQKLKRDQYSLEVSKKSRSKSMSYNTSIKKQEEASNSNENENGSNIIDLEKNKSNGQSILTEEEIDSLNNNNNNSQSRFNSSLTINTTDYCINSEGDSDHMNKYYCEKMERINLLKNVEETIYRYITEVYNETKMDDKPYRPFQINFFCLCILKLVKIYELLDKNKRAVSLLLSLNSFINKKVNDISEYLDSIVIDANATTKETIDNLIDKKVYEEKLVTEFLSESELWLEVKKRTALNALAICDYNYAILTSKSGLKDAAACKSSNFKIEFLKIIICSKIRLHSNGVKKYVGKFEEILRSPNLTLKSKFLGNIFFFDITSVLNISTYDEMLSQREMCENYFYDLIIPQALTLDNVNKLTKYSPFYTDYVIYLYQQATLYKSIHKYDLSLKCIRCAINILKYFVNISSFIYLPILNKFYQLLMMKANEHSSLKTINSICHKIVDLCIQEGGYNIQALKNGFSGLFISSVRLKETFDAINYLYILSNIGIIANNIRLLNVNTNVKARLMEQNIQSKGIKNEMKLWYAKENQLYEIYDTLYDPIDITQIKAKNDVKNHVRMDFSSFFDEKKVIENIYLYYKYLFFDTTLLDNIAFDYYSCSKMSRLQRTHQTLLHELPSDILSEITISRLVNINNATDSKYMEKFENMWMAQWFHRWYLPCDYEYEDKDDDASSLNLNEKKVNNEMYNKKNVLVIYHLNTTENLKLKELISKIKKLRKEIKLEKKRNRSSQESRILRSFSKTSRVTSREKSKCEIVSIEETSVSESCAITSNPNNNLSYSTQHKVNSILNSNQTSVSIFSSLSETLNKLEDDDLPTLNKFKLYNTNNNDNSDNKKGIQNYTTKEFGDDTPSPSPYKPIVLDEIISKSEDISNIQKEIDKNKNNCNQYKIRNKYFMMEENEFKSIFEKTTETDDELLGNNNFNDQNPKELLLKELYKSLYDKCIYSVKIPKTIVKEIQFICARNEADSKNFFFTKESDSAILDHRLKKDLIKDIVKYIVGPDIKYEISDNLLNSDNLIENISALFDSDRGMLFESNNIFSNWIFDICMKRKSLNKKLQGDGEESEELEEKEPIGITETKEDKIKKEKDGSIPNRDEDHSVTAI
ncbi:hypothetical protein BCR36DRAFT_407837 [Piromyces finnis]|uniref:Fibronectin type-III domain-containing protein n=1 Tax=Piromyces finnis TaxID=1754191 RepID=A0A1Y1VN32_9FUNG|nr:hypothetical protein BCR36DRAFT_407837 [Piromyces finnis]|eukprot:ORX60836.1 hypothetical protein BCR36DRAFT_407837 [Piromyces finnis]